MSTQKRESNDGACLSRPSLKPQLYTVGWITVLPCEFRATIAALDLEHDRPRIPGDNNFYAAGSINRHNVVIACSGEAGTNPANHCATQMLRSFVNIRIGLLSGIGGGVPTEKNEIRLGDVVVSQPSGAYGGVAFYDPGKLTDSGLQPIGHLDRPPEILRNAVNYMQTQRLRGDTQFEYHLTHMRKDPLIENVFTSMQGRSDDLFDASDSTKRLHRADRADTTPKIHYGLIASGSWVIKTSGSKRADLLEQVDGDVLCFEMEAAGLMNTFPCLVVRGISDYCDSHKNDGWHEYAAITAACYCKWLLNVITPEDVNVQSIAENVSGPQSADGSATMKSHYCMPPRNQNFVGREDCLSQLEKKLFPHRDYTKVALVGLGGIGKTQVALQFAYLVKESRPEYSIFWISALSDETIQQGYQQIALQCSIEKHQSASDIKNSVQQYLNSEKSGKWLLIVDNADDEGLGPDQKGKLKNSIKTYLPSARGLVLFTTRHKHAAQALCQNNFIKLPQMTEAEARTFFKKSLSHETDRSDDIDELLEDLAHLPLAIAQAAAYLNVNDHLSVREYLNLIRGAEEDKISALSQEFVDDTRHLGSANAVARTWFVSMNDIEKHNENSAELLAFVSILKSKWLPRALFPPLSSQAPKESMERAIGALCSYAFMSRLGDSDLYEIHSLVHLAARLWSKESGRAADAGDKMLSHLASIFPRGHHNDRFRWWIYLPHAIPILLCQDYLNKEARYLLSMKIGRCFVTDGRYSEALLWLSGAYCWYEGSKEKDHPHLLESLCQLGNAYRCLGLSNIAVKLLEHAVDIEEETRSVDDSQRAESQLALAQAYIGDGQAGKARRRLEQFLKFRGPLPEDHPDLLTSQHTLGLACREQGQIQMALEIFNDIDSIDQRRGRREDIVRLPTQLELAITLKLDGQDSKAMELLEHVVKAGKRTYDEHYPQQLAAEYYLACAYWEEGRVLEAIKLLEHIVVAPEEFLPRDHPNRLEAELMLHELRNTSDLQRD